VFNKIGMSENSPASRKDHATLGIKGVFCWHDFLRRSEG